MKNLFIVTCLLFFCQVMYLACKPVDLSAQLPLSVTSARLSASSNSLNNKDTLLRGSYLRSTNYNAFYFTGYNLIFQEDGNLVLYRNTPNPEPIWHSDTKDKGDKCIFAYGILSIIDKNKNVIWVQGGFFSEKSFLTLQDDGNVVIYGPDRKKVYWSTNTNQTFYNPKVGNITSAFNSVSTEATKVDFKGYTSDLSIGDSHIQGIAYYGDYAIVTHNNVPAKYGKLIIFNRKTNRKIHNIDINLSTDPRVKDISRFNHPGGIQVIGNFLVVPVEPYDGSKDKKSVILFYDLTPLNDYTPPYLLDFPRIYRDQNNQGIVGTGKAGAVGITNYNENGIERYCLAAFDNGNVDIYVSNGYPLTDVRLIFTLKKRINISAEGICLVTSRENMINIIGFQTVGGEDRIYQFDTDGKKINDRHLINQYGSTSGDYGVHFRWGSGLQLLNYSTKSPDFQIMCTQRNAIGNTLPVNDFRP